MRPMEDIEKRIESVPLDTSAERDKQVLDEVLKALAQSKKELPASSRPTVWRIIMKNNVTRLAAAVFVIALLAGVSQLDGARAAFAGTARVVATSLAGLREFIRDMRAREPQPPSNIAPDKSGERQTAAQGNRIFAGVQVFSVQPGQQDLQTYFQTEGIELIPAQSSSNTSYAKLGPEKTERFVELAGKAEGIKCLLSPSLMILEGQEGIMGIAGAGDPDATALALVATIPNDGNSIDLSISFLQGESGFEIPKLRVNTDEAVLFRLVAPDEKSSQDNPAGQGCTLVLVKTKVFSQT